MSDTFKVDDTTYLAENMTDEQKKMFSEILKLQNDMASIIRQHKSYDAYCRIISQQLAHSLTSEKDNEESTSEDSAEESSEE